MSASASKFQYSTSDTTNPNDHDQQKWQITFSHAHIFNEDLKIAWGASAFLNHFVFISKKFSSNNNWERNFQLTPEIIYTQGNRFYFRQRFTVRAKYQTYDFDEPETSNRNIVNRQFIINTFSVYRFSPKSRFEISANYELAEQGRFFYDLWRQTLALSWRNSEVQLFYKHKIGSQIYLSTGGSFFRQIRWEHKIKSDGKTEKIIKDKHTNYGPSIELSYRPNNSLEINFLGNIHFANSSRKKTDTINIFDINLNWFF